MRVLVACEYSGRVRDAFIALGHDAMSCDILPTETPGPHYQGDIFEVPFQGWDLLIAHPPCTYLTCAAEWAYKFADFGRYPESGYHQKVKPETLTGGARRFARFEARNFVYRIWNAPIPRIAIENPVGILSRMLGKPQVVQPHWFGDDASKATCLWTKGLPPLVKTDPVAPRMVKGKPRWANQTDSGQNRLSPGPNRAKERSLTYQGIANAFANQWGLVPHETA